MESNPFDEIPITDTEPNGDAAPAAGSMELRERTVWRPGSAIVVIGATNRGKTTTMNLYTRNQAVARGGAGATTTENKIYIDENPAHQPELESLYCGLRKKISEEGVYPVWLDTIGLHEATEVRLRNGLPKPSTETLIQEYLKLLYQNNINYIHAIVWCMTPEEAHTSTLEEEANAIQFLLRDCKESTIGANILILVKDPRDLPLDKDSTDVKGALECLPESWRREIQFEGYVLKRDQRRAPPTAISDEEALRRLELKLGNIQNPLQLQWNYKLCLDCGQIGDDRLFENTCHLEMEVVDVFPQCLNRLFFCCNTRMICAQCNEPWPRRRSNGTVEAPGNRCVQISDYDHVKEGYIRCPNDKKHNLKPLTDDQKIIFKKKIRRKHAIAATAEQS